MRIFIMLTICAIGSIACVYGFEGDVILYMFGFLVGNIAQAVL
jgi:hypothetical protein